MTRLISVVRELLITSVKPDYVVCVELDSVFGLAWYNTLSVSTIWMTFKLWTCITLNDATNSFSPNYLYSSGSSTASPSTFLYLWTCAAVAASSNSWRPQRVQGLDPAAGPMPARPGISHTATGPKSPS